MIRNSGSGNSYAGRSEKGGDHIVVVIVALVTLAALVLAALLLFSTNEGLVRCRDNVGA
jgi:hypothetical protein